MSLRARIHNKKDLAAGLLFAAIGLATVIGASDYPLGVIRNIGPGYFPIMIGIVLALLGTAVAFQSVSFGGTTDVSTGREPQQPQKKDDEEDDGGVAIRPLIMITLAVVAFGVMVRPLGLAVATVALVALSSLAGREFGLLRVVLLSVGLIALSWLTFIYLLGLPMTLWPR